MPDVRLSDETKRAIDAQPERRAPLRLSFAKTTTIIIEEALDARRRSLKRGPRLRK